MSATPEAKVKLAVQNKLKENNAYYCTPVTGGFGRSGVPDILACYRGFFVGIECKAGKGKVTALQQKNLDDIVKAGGGTAVINEENLDDIDVLLRAIDRALVNLDKLKKEK